MSIGRNYPCPCGSGKKYKQCCLDGETTWRQAIENSDIEQAIKTTLLGAFDFIAENQFKGGCHLISAILFMLLSEQGYEPIVMTGEVGIDDYVFDHSWIELDGKIIDLTIMNTLYDNKKLPPVVMNKSVSSGLEPNHKYGVSPNLDGNTQLILAQSIGQYIQAGKEHRTYFILVSIAEKSGIHIGDTDLFLQKYLSSFRKHSVAISRGER
jgi:hypothetical protein